MKKLFASLMTLVLMVSMMTGAMAYDAVTPTDDNPALTHTLTLSEADMTKLDYTITYTFTVSNTADVVQPSDVVNSDLAVTGKPVISPITYGPSDTFDTNRQCTKALEIDWSGVSIKEPGVYRWAVQKTVQDNDDNFNATNNSNTLYMFVYVTDNNGNLTISGIGLTSVEDLTGGTETKGNLSDSYPAQTLDLTISKNVSGNQGSKDQYFKFTIQLTSPAGASSTTYEISGHDTSIPKTAYHNAVENIPTSINVASGQTAEVVLYLKDGQQVTISNLIFGTSYSITESNNTGYTVTSTATGDTEGVIYSADNATVSDSELKVATTVAYNNFKEATVPTGILPMSSAPIAMMLAAAVMMMINKRKAK